MLRPMLSSNVEKVKQLDDANKGFYHDFENKRNRFGDKIE